MKVSTFGVGLITLFGGGIVGIVGLKIYQYYNPQKAATDSPVTIRGGSIIAEADVGHKKSSGWKTLTPYFSYSAAPGTQYKNAAVVGSESIDPYTVSLNAPWEIDFPDRNGSLKRGFRLCSDLATDPSGHTLLKDPNGVEMCAPPTQTPNTNDPLVYLISMDTDKNDNDSIKQADVDEDFSTDGVSRRLAFKDGGSSSHPEYNYLFQIVIISGGSPSPAVHCTNSVCSLSLTK